VYYCRVYININRDGVSTPAPSAQLPPPPPAPLHTAPPAPPAPPARIPVWERYVHAVISYKLR